MRQSGIVPLLGVAAFLMLGRGPAGAQVVVGTASAIEAASFYGAPGNYGTTWGVPSYGWPRTYSSFSSSYGAGYGYGYYPYGGGWPGYSGGLGIWRPGFVAPGYAYGAGYTYGGGTTFAVPYPPTGRAFPPGIGAYAPGFGTFVGY